MRGRGRTREDNETGEAGKVKTRDATIIIVKRVKDSEGSHAVPVLLVKAGLRVDEALVNEAG
jgi:hypothetical protein